MNRLALFIPSLLLGLSVLVPTQTRSEGSAANELKWKKTTLDKKFRSEGVAIADVNKDGKMDIIAGDVWYAAPDWKMQEIRKQARRDKKTDDGHDPANYSASFCCFTDDFNADGWVDVIVVPFPGEACFWYENPKNQPGHWKAHPVWRSACNETPNWADLFGDGKKYLLMGIQPEGQMCWFSPPAPGSLSFDMHPISKPNSPGTHRFYHGLGVGDMNGDGRNDVIIPHGWWEQPPDAKTSNAPWPFHKVNLGEDRFHCADMYVFDVDADGKKDVICSSAHRRGIWWYKQMQSPDGPFKQNDILTTFTQTHALNFVDINGDGKKDLVTGKRWWAHGAKGDEDPSAPAVLYWIEIRPGSPPTFVPHQIDDDSGIGTQFAVGDINGDGRPDIAVANKKGCFIFEQVRK